MLNYVWLALIILGIGTAVTTDFINQNQNKYRNNEAIPIEIYFNKAFTSDSSQIYNADIILTKSILKKFYKVDIVKGLKIPAKIKYNKNDKKINADLTITKNDPEILNEMAGASGEKNDLAGSIKNLNLINNNSANASIVFEEVSFLKLKDITNSVIDYAGTAVQIALGLIGIMALWLGVMKVAEDAGLIAVIAKLLKPITKRLFPDVPSDHPAMGSMIMNMSANMLGLGNAATPFGLKAMEELNDLNPKKDTASNAMCTFLAINTAGLTLIPATAIAVRAAAGSSEPAIIIGTSIFGAGCATIAGIAAAKILEKFPIKKGGFSDWWKSIRKIFFTLSGIILFVLLYVFTGFGKIVSNIFSFINPDSFKSLFKYFQH